MLQFPVNNWRKDVNNKTLTKDLFAGITGAVVVLPQGVAFAMIAGLPPINGLYTAMILPIVAALFGSSKHLISGPTTAISIVVFSAVSPLAPPGTPDFVAIAIVLAFVVGLIQLILGLVKLGVLVNFVSHTVVIGFTAGAALLIGISQLKYVFGISIPQGTSFFETIFLLIHSISTIDPSTMLVGLTTLISAVVLHKLNKRIPYMLIAMVLGSLVAFQLTLSIPMVGSLPRGIPEFSLPDFQLVDLAAIVPNAFAIALLGLIEAVAIAKSIAAKSGQKIDGNQEFVGQGLSNMVGSFFSCYPGSGSFTRSGVNYDSGAQTPMSAIFAAVLLMLLVQFFGHLGIFLPIATMGGIILLVAYNLVNFKHIREILLTSKRESVVMILTFVSTLVLDLEYAIYIGVIFSLIFYLKETSQPRIVSIAPDPRSPMRMFRNVQKYPHIEQCPQLQVIRIEGSIFFGAIESVSAKLDKYYAESMYCLVIANNINLLDTSGASFLVKTKKKWSEAGKKIYFSGFKLRARQLLKDGGYWQELGEDIFFENKQDGIKKIYQELDADVCSTCTMRIFNECTEAPSVETTNVEKERQ
jgi:SulP family sulfate permease